MTDNIRCNRNRYTDDDGDKSTFQINRLQNNLDDTDEDENNTRKPEDKVDGTVPESGHDDTDKDIHDGEQETVSIGHVCERFLSHCITRGVDGLILVYRLPSIHTSIDVFLLDRNRQPSNDTVSSADCMHLVSTV